MAANSSGLAKAGNHTLYLPLKWSSQKVSSPGAQEVRMYEIHETEWGKNWMGNKGGLGSGWSGNGHPPLLRVHFGDP